MSRIPRWLLAAFAPLLLILASAIFVGVNVAKHDKISPVDEYVYIDYYVKVFEQGPVAYGEQTSEWARNYLACHGVAPDYEFAPESCNVGDHSDPGLYPFNGANTADIYTPAYFWISRVLAQPIQFFFGADIITAARLTGFWWLAAGALLLYATQRRLRVSRTLAASLGVIMIASLSSWWSVTYVSTDATAITAGAAIAYLTVRHLQRPRWYWMAALSAASVLAVALKFQNLMAVVAAAMVLLLAGISGALERRRAARAGGGSAAPVSTVAVSTAPESAALGPVAATPSAPAPAGAAAPAAVTLPPQPGEMRRIGLFAGLASAALLTGLALAFQVVWVLVRPFETAPGTVSQGNEGELSLAALLVESVKFFGAFVEGATGAAPFGAYAIVITGVVGWLLVAGIIGNLVVGRAGIAQHVSLAVLATSVLGGPALAVATTVAAGYYFPLPARYSISLCAFALVATALFFSRRRAWTWVFAALALVSFVVGLRLYFPGS